MPAIRPVGHEDRLTLVEHLDELRTRLILCVVAFIAAFSLCYWQNERVLDVVNKPLENSRKVNCDQISKKVKDPLERSGCFDQQIAAYLKDAAPALRDTGRTLQALGRGDGVPAATQAAAARSARELQALAASAARAAAAVPDVGKRQPVTLGVTEPFLTTITVSAYVALLFVLPFLLYQLYAFVLPAFTADEKRIALPLMALVPVLFTAGVAFGYLLALPRAVTFLQNYNDGQFDILVQARDYYRFAVILLAGTGVLFQIPVGVLLIVRLQVLSTKQLRQFRGYALILFAIVAAVVTPTPDPFTMLITMAPLVVLYELSIQLARIFEPKGPSRWSFFEGDADDDALD